jgi:hypothetical protein
LQIDRPQLLNRVRTLPPLPKVVSRAPPAARAEFDESNPARHIRLIKTATQLRIDRFSFDMTGTSLGSCRTRPRKLQRLPPTRKKAVKRHPLSMMQGGASKADDIGTRDFPGLANGIRVPTANRRRRPYPSRWNKRHVVQMVE